MAGNKNSGRRGGMTNYAQAMRHRVLDKAWIILEQALDNVELSLKERLEIAKTLASRNIPQIIDATLDAQVTEMPPIKRDETRLDPFLIGTPENGESV